MACIADEVIRIVSKNDSPAFKELIKQIEAAKAEFKAEEVSLKEAGLEKLDLFEGRFVYGNDSGTFDSLISTHNKRNTDTEKLIRSILSQTIAKEGLMDKIKQQSGKRIATTKMKSKKHRYAQEVENYLYLQSQLMLDSDSDSVDVNKENNPDDVGKIVC